jgi:hypothetical protein
MMAGAMAELRVGDAADLATDVGPLIDAEAFAGRHRAPRGAPAAQARLVAEGTLHAAGATHQVPIAFEIDAVQRPGRAKSSARCCTSLRWSGDVDAAGGPHQRARLRADAGRPDAHRRRARCASPGARASATCTSTAT